MNKYQSEALMVIHQSARDLFELGVISAAEMREFDDDCLAREPAARKPASRKPARKASGGKQAAVPASAAGRSPHAARSAGAATGRS